MSAVGVIERARCRSCDAPVIFATSITGKQQILDATPAGRGTFVLIGRESGEPWALSLSNLSDRAREAARDNDVALYVDHHATCPDVESWRR